MIEINNCYNCDCKQGMEEMIWQKDGTWWKAVGKNGTIWVRRIRGVWWAWYKPNESPKIWLLSSTNLTEVKRRCELTAYWE